MLRKLTKHGNSYALVIDRPILELLRIDPEALLEVTTDGKVLIVAPASGRRARVAASAEKVNAKYGRALRKLAE